VIPRSVENRLITSSRAAATAGAEAGGRCFVGWLRCGTARHGSGRVVGGPTKARTPPPISAKAAGLSHVAAKPPRDRFRCLEGREPVRDRASADRPEPPHGRLTVAQPNGVGSRPGREHLPQPLVERTRDRTAGGLHGRSTNSSAQSPQWAERSSPGRLVGQTSR